MSKLIIKGGPTGSGSYTITGPSTALNLELEIPNSGGTLHTSEAANNNNVMPTVNGDPIVESGSNSNGTWYRFASGMQICTTPYVGYNPGGNGNPWTFPLPFITFPRHIWATDLYAGSYTPYVYQNNNNSSTGTFIRGIANDASGGASANLSGREFYVTALGDWK